MQLEHLENEKREALNYVSLSQEKNKLSRNLECFPQTMERIMKCETTNRIMKEIPSSTSWI